MGIDEVAALPPRWSARPLALLVAGALFMEILDGTIIAPAAPSIARSFSVPASSIASVISTYMLTVAVFIPASGWLTDRFGARAIFCSALTIFGLSSALCAASTGLLVLVLMRVLQGVGGAMMVPVGRLVVLRGTAKQDLIKAIAYLVWPALVAPVLAPSLGGALTTYFSWRSIFLVNLPLVAVALVAARRLVPRTRSSEVTSLDWMGLILCAAALGLVVEASTILSESAISLGPLVAVAGLAVVLSIVAVTYLRRASQPLLDLSPFAVKTFRLSHLSGSLFRMTVNAIPFMLALMLEEGFGWTPVKSGTTIIFLFIGNLAIKPFTTPMLRRWPFRTVVIVSCGAEAATFVACAFLKPSTPLAVIAAVILLSGVFRSVGFTAYNTIAFADVGQQDMRDANTVSSTLQQLAAGLGVAAGALAIRVGMATAKAPALHPLVAYRIAFLIVAALVAAPIVEALGLSADAGSAIRVKA